MLGCSPRDLPRHTIVGVGTVHPIEESKKPVPCNGGAKKRKRTVAVDMSYENET